VACGRTVDRRAAYCPWCGASLRGLAIEGDASETQPANEVALGSPRRWPLPVAVVAVAGIVVAGAVLTGRGNESVQAQPTTTTATSTSSASSPSTTEGAPLVEHFTPPAQMPAGITLVGLTEDHRRFSARIAFGEVTSRRLDQAVNDEIGDQLDYVFGLGFPVGHEAIFRTNPPLVVPSETTSPARVLDPTCGLFGPVGDRVWSVRCSDELGAPLEVAEAPVDGIMRREEVEVPAAAQPVGVDGNGGLVLRAASGYYVLAEDGTTPQLLTRNELLAVSATVLVERACDEQLECRLQVVDRATGVARPLELESVGSYFAVLEGALSPDGRWLVLPNPGNSFAAAADAGVLVDLLTGEHWPFEAGFQGGPFQAAAPSGIGWTPDGTWALWVDSRGGVRALDVVTRSVVPIGVGTILDRARSIVVVPVTG